MQILEESEKVPPSQLNVSNTEKMEISKTFHQLHQTSWNMSIIR